MGSPPDVEMLRSQIPADLQAQPTWVCWRFQVRNGRQTKVPVCTRTTRDASSTDPSTWSSFDDAILAWEKDARLDGIGFVFPPDGSFVGIDLDECIGEGGELSDGAREIVELIGSYTETSPSGRGVKIFIRARKPEVARCVTTKVEGAKRVEVYSKGRFFTVTGRHLVGASRAVEERQAALDVLYARLWPTKTQHPLRPSVSHASLAGFNGDDDALVARAGAARNGEKFRGLWAGDTSMNSGDESAADLALCSILAFWAGPDADRIDRLFRRSGLYRDKWDARRGARTYGQMTVERAVEGCREFHNAAPCPDDGSHDAPSHLLPRILLAPDEHRVVDEAVAALAKDAGLFQRGNALVRVVRAAGVLDGIKRGPGAAWISPLPLATLRERLTLFMEFVRLVRRGGQEIEIEAHPPGWVVNAVGARGDWPGVRRLVALSGTPVLRPDGTLFQRPGFDEATGVLLDPSAEFPAIPDGVSIDDADAAVTSLLDVIGDFRFERPEHKSAFIAALLTPLARFAFDGPAPLFLFDANVRGAGKGLLVQVIGRIALGREIPVSSYSHDTEEMRKKITAAAIAGDRIVNLDNLEGRLGNDALDRALTTTQWRDRILGRSEQVELPLHAVWFASGNNVAVAADTARRVIHIRLDVLEESPENRGDFKRPRLLEWVQQNRARLLIDALTILVAYSNAGRPSQGLAPFGSFEGWSRLVREAVVWAGLPDPCLTRTTLAESSDTVRDTLEQLIAAWRGYDPTGEGIVVPVLLAKLYDRPIEPADEASGAMRAALENLVGSAPGRAPDARRVGNRLKAYRRRVVAGFYIDIDPAEKTRMGALWRLKTKVEGGSP